MIVPVKSGYRVQSHDSKRSYGTYKTQEAAQARLAQVKSYPKNGHSGMAKC